MRVKAQRYSCPGIGNLLVLYLIKYFSYSTPRATQIFGAYTGIAFILPIFGGYVADKWNYTKPILLGSLLTTTGALLLSTLQQWAILPALSLLCLGGGLFTPSIYSLLGKIYTKRHAIREGGFTIFYAAVNLGIFLAMIISGYLQTINWRFVFIVSAAVQLLGLIPYSLVVKRLKNNRENFLPSNHYKKESLHYLINKKHERDRIIVILILTFVSVLFWMAFNQAGSSMTLFANSYTNRNVLGFLIPPPWFLSIETLFLALLAFPLTLLYLFLRKIKSNASPPMKTALSLFFMGLCFLVMQRAASGIPA
ncbi:MAG: MFS transporter, partial [Simkania negevensis]|nr:MFS transporter [Simkania negevensis]